MVATASFQSASSEAGPETLVVLSDQGELIASDISIHRAVQTIVGIASKDPGRDTQFQ